MDNHYKAGERLPSEHQLASQFLMLAEERSARPLKRWLSWDLKRERGRGTFVADRSQFLVGPIALGF